MNAAIGLLIVAGSLAGFWHMLPTRGKVNRLAAIPVIESMIPLLIVAGIAMGFALTATVFIR